MKLKGLALILSFIPLFGFSLALNQNNQHQQVSAIDEPELVEYDRVSLKQCAIPDFDRTSINTEDVGFDSYNTFAYSSSNSTHSFSFSFEFEAYGLMNDNLYIRIGATGGWDSGHFYFLVINNNHETTGSIELYERNNNTTIYYSNHLKCDLTKGSRHVIEFGSVYLKNSTVQTYDYVKYDDSLLFGEVKTPYNSSRTGRVGLYYSGNNIYLGNCIPLQEQNINNFGYRETALNKDGQLLGVYLTKNADDGNVPYSTDWDCRGTQLDLDNVLLNGERFLTYNASLNPQFVKSNVNEYFYDIESVNDRFTNGDVLSIGGYFNIIKNKTSYLVYSNPIYLLYKDLNFTLINDINQYFVDTIKDQYKYEYYDFINSIIVEDLVDGFLNEVTSISSPKEKWVAYQSALIEIKKIPFDEEKVAELLNKKKTELKAALDSYNNNSLYEGENLNQVIAYISEYKTKIDNSTDLNELDDLLDDFIDKVKLVPTRYERISQEIIANAEGFEEYLCDYDVVTTTDLNVAGGIHVYEKDGTKSSFNNTDQKEGATYYRSENNISGNVIFQANYISDNPLSSENESQFFIRLRGDTRTNYRFGIGGDPSLTIVTRKDDKTINEENKHYNFIANTNYKIELGSIDLKDFDKTYLFIKVNGALQLSKIVDTLDYSLSNNLIIMDSYTKDNTNYYASLLPIEEGTTKLDKFTPIGRFKLDELSSKEKITLNLSKNDIPALCSIYIADENAVTINGNQINSINTTKAIFVKESATSYSVKLNDFGYSFSDGDTFSFGGLFSIFNSNTRFKAIYKIYNSTFVYHGATNSFSEVSPNLDDVKLEAKETVSRYYDLDDYSSEGQSQINLIVNDFMSNVDSVSSVDEAYQLLDNTLNNISNVPTYIQEYSQNKKTELNNYLDRSLYKEEEIESIDEILAEYSSYIDASMSTDEIDDYANLAKAELDKVLTREEKETYELNEYKKSAQISVEKFIGKLDLSKYARLSIRNIQKIISEAKSDIANATSEEEIDQILENFYQEINEIKTKNGSVFDGEKYIIKVETKSNILIWLLPIVIGGVLIIGAAVITIVIIKKKKAKTA